MTGIESLRLVADHFMEMTVSYDLGKSLEQIADQIERETLPRPCFEDGEAVQFGDMIDVNGRSEKVQGFKFYKSGPSFISVVGVDHEKWVRVEKGEHVKEYERVKSQAVLDADGVPIEAGDMVWRVSLPGFGPYKVHHVDKTEGMAYIESRDLGLGMAVTYTFKPEDLTHKKSKPPAELSDSWDRIESDVEKDTCDYFGYVSRRGCRGCKAFLSGRPCEQDKMFDIVQRCRALAEKK